MHLTPVCIHFTMQHCFGTFFRDHSWKCCVSHSGNIWSWTMGNIWGPLGQRECLCSPRLGRHNNSIKITAETVAAVFSKERAEEFELSVSAGHPHWRNWSSEGCQSFVWGLALVQDVDMVLTSQEVVVFSKALLTGEKKLVPRSALVICQTQPRGW